MGRESIMTESDGLWSPVVYEQHNEPSEPPLEYGPEEHGERSSVEYGPLGRMGPQPTAASHTTV
jgi:hypothetical protein